MGNGKWEMGIAIKKLTHSLTTCPLTQKGFFFFFFLMKEKSSWKFFIGEGFSKEKGRKTIPK